MQGRIKSLKRPPITNTSIPWNINHYGIFNRDKNIQKLPIEKCFSMQRKIFLKYKYKYFLKYKYDKNFNFCLLKMQIQLQLLLLLVLINVLLIGFNNWCVNVDQSVENTICRCFKNIEFYIKKHLLEVLHFCFRIKKSLAKCHHLEMEIYIEHPLPETIYRDSLRRFFRWCVKAHHLVLNCDKIWKMNSLRQFHHRISWNYPVTPWKSKLKHDIHGKKIMSWYNQIDSVYYV